MGGWGLPKFTIDIYGKSALISRRNVGTLDRSVSVGVLEYGCVGEKLLPIHPSTLPPLHTSTHPQGATTDVWISE